jgi:uncharacterized protein DUF4352
LRIQSQVENRRFRNAVWIAVVALIALAALGTPHLAAQAISAATHAKPAGIPFNTIIIFGDQYNGGDELYNARITVAEIVRGEKAWQLVRKASTSNKPASAGFEYLLVRVRFEFSARTGPAHYSYTLEPVQFAAMSSDNKPYETAVLAEPLKPALHATLRSGDSAEGWVAFLVRRGDHTPLMLFHEDVGSVIHEGSGSIFKLYYENSYENSPIPGETNAF